MLNILTGIETNILKEIPCLNVYLQNTSLYSKNYQNTAVSVWERRKRAICTYFVGQMTGITVLPSKLRKITLVYYKEIPLMFLVCIPLGFGARFPVQAEILLTCKSYQVSFKFFHFVCTSVNFFLHRKSIEASTFYSQSWKGTVWLLEMTKSPAGEAEYNVCYLGHTVNF